jgi:aspartate racemase
VGGNVLAFEGLARHLGTDQPVFGLQAKGLNGTDEPFTRIEDMAAYYLDEIRRFQRHGPYLLGGHSMGARVAYEMARQLDQRGERAGIVAVIDTYGRRPVMTHRMLAWWQELLFQIRRVRFHAADRVVSLSRHQGTTVRQKLRTLRRRWHSRGWQAQYASYRERSADGGVLPESFYDVEQACYLAARTYLPGEYSGRVTLFRACDAGLRRDNDPQMGWGQLALGGVDVHEIPGNHETILAEPNVRVLAEKLRKCLDQLTARRLRGGFA